MIVYVGGEEMATFSLCMIVKNEEKVLARCLDTIADLMDEIIIVDTGSTDRTKEIAARYTSQVYDYTWRGDFADARNFASSKATKEYIYTADADEVLDETNRERLSQLKQVLLPEVEIVQMVYCNDLGDTNTTANFDRELRPKLYRRVRSFTWIEPIHETLRLDPVVFDSDIEVLHRPETNHAQRDLERLQKLQSQGILLSDKLHHMYAMELFIAGTDRDFLEAEESFLATMERESTPDRIQEALCVLTRIYRLKKDSHHFMMYAMKGMALGGCAELCCELGAYYESVGEYGEAATWYYNAIHETESILNIACHTTIPAQGMENCEKYIDL
jgi:glycosyltransferase involved in cell wall biosynthesis